MRTLYALIGCALLAACASTRLPVATQADAERAGVELSELESGRLVYLNRCTSCHRPIQPKKYAAEQWMKHVAEMKEKARLNDAEYRSVLAYLQTMSEAPIVE